MHIEGSCHCGNIAFTLEWTPEPTAIPARACTCTFCVKHGGVWTSCPTGSLEVRLREPASVSLYRFGTRTADFHVCSRCGAAPVVTSTIDGITYAVVSVHAFDNVPRAMLREAPAAFDDETEASRLGRRARNWIPRVRFVDAGARGSVRSGS